MPYVPPHKRHSAEGQAPTPESLAPLFRQNLNFRSNSGNSSNNNRNQGGPRIVYAPDATSKWFPVGLGPCFGFSDDDADKFMSFTKLDNFSSGSYEKKFGAKPRALVLDLDRINEYDGERGVVLENPWDFIAANVKQDLVSAIQRVKEEMKEDDCELIKPTLVARFGRVIFKGALPTLSGCSLKDLNEAFHTNVSPSVVKHVVDEVFPKLRPNVELEKELFVVLLSDSRNPRSTISCKCTVAKDGKTLQLYKIQLNQERHFVADMSCLGKSLDLRLMLLTKRTGNTLTDDEIKCIKSVIGSAVVDPEVRGGLRWPLGTNSSGNRYTVIAVWHVNAKVVQNSSVRLKVRHADRFNFGSSSGDVAREVSLQIYDVMSQLQMQPIQDDLLTETLRNSLKLLWDNLVCFPSTT